MPVTRRKRANPPEEPENNNNHTSEKEQQEQPVDASVPTTAPDPEVVAPPAPPSASEQPEAPPSVEPAAAQEGQPVEAPRQEEKASFAPIAPVAPAMAAPPSANGDRTDRHEHTPPPPAEGVRRPVREAFRRPSHMQQQAAQPVQQAAPPPPPVVPAPPPLQPPSHEISLPLGNLLHLAYNPGYTGSDEARSALLAHLARESKAGGRARCWNCGSVAIVYERWNTRSKTFGEIGIAFCEICGVWSVM